jgi:hypothetical protein
MQYVLYFNASACFFTEPSGWNPMRFSYTSIASSRLPLAYKPSAIWIWMSPPNLESGSVSAKAAYCHFTLSGYIPLPYANTPLFWGWERKKSVGRNVCEG